MDAGCDDEAVVVGPGRTALSPPNDAKWNDAKWRIRNLIRTTRMRRERMRQGTGSSRAGIRLRVIRGGKTVLRSGDDAGAFWGM
jgi:hypothetical protein